MTTSIERIIKTFDIKKEDMSNSFVSRLQKEINNLYDNYNSSGVPLTNNQYQALLKLKQMDLDYLLTNPLLLLAKIRELKEDEKFLLDFLISEKE